MRSRLFLYQAICLFFLAAAAHAAEDLFTIAPDPPEVGKALSITIKPEVMAKTPLWGIAAFKGDAPVAADMAGIPNAVVDGPKVDIPKPVADTKYVFTVAFTRGNQPEETWKIILDFTKMTASKLILPPSTGVTPPVVPMPGAIPGAPPVAPAPLLSTGDSVQEQLAGARKWAEQIAKFQKTDNLIVSVEFFKEALNKTREYVREDKRAVKSTLQRKMDRPLLDAARFFTATENVLKSQPADADSATLELAWAAEKEKFITALVEENAEAKSTANLWRVFLDEWQAEAKRVAPTRFRDALTEGPLVLTAILLGYEKEHIQAAMTGGGPKGSTSTSSTGGSSGTFGVSHAAVHHARAMSRIHMRNQRRLARIGAY